MQAVWTRIRPGAYPRLLHLCQLHTTVKISAQADDTLTCSSSGEQTLVTNPVLSRYLNLVQKGALRHDHKQIKVVARLGRIYDDIHAYSMESAAFLDRMQEYQERQHERLLELYAEEEKQKQQTSATGSASEPSPSQNDWVPSWILKTIGYNGSSLDTTSGTAPQKQLTPEQQQRLIAARLQKQVLKELGPPPPPPAAPKGLYLWGSVGSGKSLLMDIFYDAVASTLPQLKHHRRMHFNAAMLEVHSRIHKLDQEERARQQRFSDTRGDEGTHTATASQVKAEEDGKDDEEELKPSVEQPALDKRGLFRYWDAEVQRQREAKAAMLAIRKHMRLAREGRRDPEALGKSNSDQMKKMASEFLLSRATHSITSVADSATKKEAEIAVQPQHMAAVLCFDEMQVSDVFSAVALKALLEGLTQAGCVVVTTSNRTPRDLPRHGLHEDMFENLIQTIEATCDVHELSVQEDYRRLLLHDRSLSAQASNAYAALANAVPASPATDSSKTLCKTLSLADTFLYPLDPATHEKLEESWSLLVQSATKTGGPSCTTTIPVMFGRVLEVPHCAGGVARFSFEELCARTLGPADYVALASSFHTVVITHVPVMSMQVRDQARRFITLVDELYNARVRLICSAAAPPDNLFSGGIGGPGMKHEEPILDLEQLQFESAVEGSRLRTNLMEDGGVAPLAASADAAREAAARLGGAEEQFAFARAVSRLHEMQSPAYLTASAIARQWG